MTFGNHALDDRRIGSRSVNRTFSEVIAGNEKGCVETELLEDIEELAGIKVWAIVVRQSHDVVFNAVINIVVVRDTAE